MTPTLWATLGALSAVVLEWAYRRWPEHDWLDFWPLLPLMLAINYSVYRVMRASTTLLEGFVVFGVMTACLRMLVSTGLLGEPLTFRMGVSVALLLAARIVQVVRWPG